MTVSVIYADLPTVWVEAGTYALGRSRAGWFPACIANVHSSEIGLWGTTGTRLQGLALMLLGSRDKSLILSLQKRSKKHPIE